jgi:predicted lipid-binding transport protein (Tim44 family)
LEPKDERKSKHFSRGAVKPKRGLRTAAENELAAVLPAPHVVKNRCEGGCPKIWQSIKAQKEMGEFQQYFDIILFAMVAAFLVLRLRSVLGRRTGNERRRDLFPRRARPAPDKVPAVDETAQNPVGPASGTAAVDEVAEGVSQIRRADPSFDPADFLAGARAAFDMIVTAFAKGDKPALRPLLSDEVFQQFATAIDERSAARETLETRILQLDGANLVEAELAGRTAQVTAKLVSRQINVTRAMDGSIVDGDPEHPIEKTDYWTFARDTRSTDPNWVLIATSSG